LELIPHNKNGLNWPPTGPNDGSGPRRTVSSWYEKSGIITPRLYCHFAQSDVRPRYNNREKAEISRTDQRMLKLQKTAWIALLVALILFQFGMALWGTLNRHSEKSYDYASYSDDRIGNNQGKPEGLYVKMAYILDTAASYCASHPQDEKQKWLHDYVCDANISDTLIAAFSLLLVLVTGGLVGVGYLQLRQTKILERAYISVEPLGISPFVSDDQTNLREIVGHINFVNVGRLPARDASIIQASLTWCECLLEEKDLKFKEHPPMKIVIPPGTKMPLGTNPYPGNHIGGDGYFYVWVRLDTQTDSAADVSLNSAIGILANRMNWPPTAANASKQSTPVITNTATTQTSLARELINPWALADVRFGAHYGLKSDIA
jgi:hypothetical protein